MTELIQRYLAHAEDSLDAADILLDHNQVLALANRSYYAIFYCICALLLTEGVATKKHEGARVKFHELFIKTGKFGKESGKILERNFEARQSADYDMDTDITGEQAQTLIKEAKIFCSLTIDYFKKNPVSWLPLPR